MTLLLLAAGNIDEVDGVGGGGGDDGDDDDGEVAGTYDDGGAFVSPSLMACSSATFMSGTFLTSSRRKSKRLSDIMHCFMCDGDNVLAFRLFVIRNVLFNSESTNNSNVLGVFQLRKIGINEPNCVQTNCVQT